MQDETSLVMLEDSFGHERPGCAMLDPGAPSFLTGSGLLIRCVNHLRQLGYDTNKLQLQRCHRVFHFGGDHQKVISWGAKVPVYLNGQHGLIQCFVLSGETPILIGRPVIRASDMTIDFSQQKVKFGDADWQDAILGRHEEYLLDLTSSFDSEQLMWEPSFGLQLDEKLGNFGSLEDFLMEEHLCQVEEQMPLEDTFSLTTKHWKILVMQTQAQLKSMNTLIDQAIKQEHQASSTYPMGSLHWTSSIITDGRSNWHDRQNVRL